MSAEAQAREALKYISELIAETERLHQPFCECSAASELGKYRCIPSQLAGWLARFTETPRP